MNNFNELLIYSDYLLAQNRFFDSLLIKTTLIRQVFEFSSENLNLQFFRSQSSIAVHLGQGFGSYLNYFENDFQGKPFDYAVGDGFEGLYTDGALFSFGNGRWEQGEDDDENGKGYGHSSWSFIDRGRGYGDGYGYESGYGAGSDYG